MPPPRQLRARRGERRKPPRGRPANRIAGNGWPDRRRMAAAHRTEFSESLDGDVAVVGAAPVAVRSGDVEFDYRQDNDFLYLTGFPEPEAVAVFAPRHPEHRYVLFVLPRDPERARAGSTARTLLSPSPSSRSGSPSTSSMATASTTASAGGPSSMTRS